MTRLETLFWIIWIRFRIRAIILPRYKVKMIQKLRNFRKANLNNLKENLT